MHRVSACVEAPRATDAVNGSRGHGELLLERGEHLLGEHDACLVGLLLLYGREGGEGTQRDFRTAHEQFVRAAQEYRAVLVSGVADCARFGACQGTTLINLEL